MRTITPLDRKSQKKDLGSDAKILVTLIKEQPLKKKDLIKKARIDPSTFSRAEPLLLDTKAIKIVDNEYCLSNYDEKKEDMNELFLRYEKEYKQTATLEEIANAMGQPPDDIKRDVYAFGKEYGIIITEK